MLQASAHGFFAALTAAEKASVPSLLSGIQPAAGVPAALHHLAALPAVTAACTQLRIGLQHDRGSTAAHDPGLRTGFGLSCCTMNDLQNYAVPALVQRQIWLTR